MGNFFQNVAYNVEMVKFSLLTLRVDKCQQKWLNWYIYLSIDYAKMHLLLFLMKVHI